ncbi:MAG: exonuclease SbcCD subunit D [Lachnospiraceae bacterium]
MRFIHIADVHLGAIPDEGKDWSIKRKQDLWDSFAEVLELAKTSKVECIFISGDLFHRQPLLKELKEINYLFGRIPKIRIIFMAGNHDYIHPNSYYRTFQWEENVSFFGQEEIQTFAFKEDNMEVYGLSYWHREIRDAMYDEVQIKDPNALNILLVHGGDARHIPFHPEHLANKGFDYIACGHIHKGGILHGTNVVMAGALEPIVSTDLGQHGYWMGEVTKRSCSVKFYPIRKCEYVSLSVTIDPSMTNLQVIDKITEILSYAEPFEIYKFILSGYKSPEMEYELDRILELDQVVAVYDETLPDYDFERLKTVNENQMIGRYITAMEQNGDEKISKKALYYGIDALCRTMRS